MPPAAFCFSQKMIIVGLPSSFLGRTPRLYVPYRACQVWLLDFLPTQQKQLQPGFAGRGHQLLVRPSPAIATDLSTEAWVRGQQAQFLSLIVGRDQVRTQGQGGEHVLKRQGAQSGGERSLEESVHWKLLLSLSLVTASIWSNEPSPLRWEA